MKDATECAGGVAMIKPCDIAEMPKVGHVGFQSVLYLNEWVGLASIQDEETLDAALIRLNERAGKHGYELKMKTSLELGSYVSWCKKEHQEQRLCFICSKPNKNGDITYYNRIGEKAVIYGQSNYKFARQYKILVSIHLK